MSRPNSPGKPPQRTTSPARQPRPDGNGKAGQQADPVEIVIDHLGSQGDGIADWHGEKLYVPFALSGERVSVTVGPHQGDGRRARVRQVLEPAASRVAPPCQHFGSCGGCALQHLEMTQYWQWKADSVLTTLAQRGIEPTTAPSLVFVPAGARRRAAFAVTRGSRAFLGGVFSAPQPQNIQIPHGGNPPAPSFFFF